jgi:hypothetical protein
VKYFEFPITGREKFLCSDDACPCAGMEPLEPGRTGYLYITNEVVSYREDCLTWQEFLSKLDRFQRALPGDVAKVIFSAGTVSPVFLCEQGARNRKLNIRVAASDATNWVRTGRIPLRVTPLKALCWRFWKHDHTLISNQNIKVRCLSKAR